MKHNKKLEKLGLELWRDFETKSALKSMISNEDIYREQITYFSKLRGLKFKALLHEGFTREEALYLLERTNLLG